MMHVGLARTEGVDPCSDTESLWQRAQALGRAAAHGEGDVKIRTLDVVPDAEVVCPFRNPPLI